MKTLAVVSGGMDSVTMAYGLARSGDLAGIITFDYGQRHRREVEYAAKAAEVLGRPWELVALRDYGRIVNSALTVVTETVPEGHYTEDSMKATVVPNRNMVMLSIAAGFAISNDHEAIATAVHAGDHAIYPDCRDMFITKLEDTIRAANEGFCNPAFRVLSPFVYITKAQIVAVGAKWYVPYEDTWSCYKGGEIHCGRCATCIERMEAFIVAHVPDPTEYADWSKYKELQQAGKVEK